MLQSELWLSYSVFPQKSFRVNYGSVAQATRNFILRFKKKKQNTPNPCILHLTEWKQESPNLFRRCEVSSFSILVLLLLSTWVDSTNSRGVPSMFGALCSMRKSHTHVHTHTHSSSQPTGECRQNQCKWWKKIMLLIPFPSYPL